MLKWFPWRYLVTRLARAYGFLDPIQLLTRLRGFAQPSEVSEPVELLRAGMLFHARGLINTKAIQHNLDWVWPYWVERQFNPSDHSFIPRAFSFSHINLTHRNWTAVGLPGLALYPIVDPRGLVTPLYDGWSLDFWLIGKNDRWLFPSKLDKAEQRVKFADNLRVVTRLADADWELTTDVTLELKERRPICVVRVNTTAPADAMLAVVVRPYNPEGISFVDSIRIEEDRRHWRVNNTDRLIFNRAPEKCYFSTYRQGDVAHLIEEGGESDGAECPVSMASGAALFPVGDLQQEPLEVRVPVTDELADISTDVDSPRSAWRTEVDQCSRLRIPDARLQELYDIAVRSVILHCPGEVYPGPYTYKRFWYRDAAFILNALITLGGKDRTRRALDLFPKGQTITGYFRSQDGEWDSNGEVLWILHRYLQLTGEPFPDAWKSPIEKGARWILHKRLPKNSAEPHAGLLPSGFSAEHLGPNDYYYWDNFWSVAGLRAAAAMLRDSSADATRGFTEAADEYLETIVTSYQFIPERRFKGAVAASPHRRMDAGAVGSLVADYPLQLFPPGESRMMKTVEYLLAHSSHDGGFFQNMIHSGINAYLTLHLAQVLLRAGDQRALDLVDTVARLATSTGQWPEAIHPQTGGGCMGDGQHIWAAADWLMTVRNLFVREENNRLVIGPGLFPRWLEKREHLSFGPTLTPFGPVTVRVEPEAADQFRVAVDAEWRGQAPELDIRVPGCKLVQSGEQGGFVIQREL